MECLHGRVQWSFIYITIYNSCIAIYLKYFTDTLNKFGIIVNQLINILLLNCLILIDNYCNSILNKKKHLYL